MTGVKTLISIIAGSEEQAVYEMRRYLLSLRNRNEKIKNAGISSKEQG